MDNYKFAVGDKVHYKKTPDEHKRVHTIIYISYYGTVDLMSKNKRTYNVDPSKLELVKEKNMKESKYRVLVNGELMSYDLYYNINEAKEAVELFLEDDSYTDYTEEEIEILEVVKIFTVEKKYVLKDVENEV